MARWAWTREPAYTRGDLYTLHCGDLDGSLELAVRLENPAPVLDALCAALGEHVQTGPSRPIDPKQRQRIQIGMAALGYREKPKRIAVLSSFLGRPITSTNDLTDDEAEAVLARIEQRKREHAGAAA